MPFQRRLGKTPLSRYFPQWRVKDKDIQAILRHSNVGLTMNVYVKSVSESQVSAMDALSEKLGTCNDLTTGEKGPVM
jgi:hypothetical protein